MEGVWSLAAWRLGSYGLLGHGDGVLVFGGALRVRSIPRPLFLVYRVARV